jgi:nucleoside-diphosphate-sugar epimerase
MSFSEKHLFVFGLGFCGTRLAVSAKDKGWTVSGTTRGEETAQNFNDLQNINCFTFDGSNYTCDENLERCLTNATHVLLTIPPGENGDVVLNAIGHVLIKSKVLQWVAYLSTTAVYGDRSGELLDENAPLAAGSIRGKRRVRAETDWLASGLPVHVFRLPGIYGPGRGPFAKVRNGTARRIIKHGQVFSRTHVADIARILAASIKKPNIGSIYNICDNDPAPPEDVIAYAAELLGMPIPEAIDFKTADMTPMARSFYAESKKVRNDKIKTELGVELLYPDYKTGLKALLAREVEG